MWVHVAEPYDSRQPGCHHIHYVVLRVKGQVRVSRQMGCLGQYNRSGKETASRLETWEEWSDNRI